MSQEVARQAPTELMVLSSEASLETVQEAISEHVGVGGITEFAFDRIKIPSGGGLSFTVNTLEGEEMVKSITGVIVLARDARAYWEQSMEEGGGNQPPDCHSNDGSVGIGNPGGDCAKCPFSQFGSDTKVVKGVTVAGKGQACKAIRGLFLLTGNSLLPTVLSLPPTSLKAIKQYMLRLAGQGVPYWSVYTKIGLEKSKNDGGVEYAKATFTFVGKLSPDQKEKAKAYSAMLKPLVSNMMLDATTGGAPVDKKENF